MSQPVRHLGIIMDGNRRWAKARGLSPLAGHRAGYKKVEEVLHWCREAGVGTLTLFAFSTENWGRARDEVNFLMQLFYLAFSREIKRLHANGVRVRLLGRRAGLPKRVLAAVKKAEALTKHNAGGNLNLAINYGGRAELVDAVKKIVKNPPSLIDEAAISRRLYTAGQPDPDLIIRTSGERRLSGFLTWQSAYAELLFIKHHWPAFSKKDFDGALADFARRQRRFGK